MRKSQNTFWEPVRKSSVGFGYCVTSLQFMPNTLLGVPTILNIRYYWVSPSKQHCLRSCPGSCQTTSSIRFFHINSRSWAKAKIHFESQRVKGMLGLDIIWHLFSSCPTPCQTMSCIHFVHINVTNQDSEVIFPRNPTGLPHLTCHIQDPLLSFSTVPKKWSWLYVIADY
jgi:hypothetical protein